MADRRDACVEGAPDVGRILEGGLGVRAKGGGPQGCRQRRLHGLESSSADPTAGELAERLLLRGSTEPLAPPWMLWRAFWPPFRQCFFCGFPCRILPRTCVVLAQPMGCATPILALGSHWPVAFVRLLVPKRTMRRCLFDS